MSVVRTKFVVVGLGALALAACSGGPGRVKPVSAPPVAASVESETDAAFDLLMQGKEGPATGKLKSILKRDPMNAPARLLSESIKGDPKDLLGPQSYPYTARTGDTVEGLAQRFLGNRLKAYQLIRYNGLKAPVTLAAGQVIRIPGEPPRPEPVRRPDPAPAKPAPSTTPGASRLKPDAPKPAAPGANPVAARQLRTAGLAALNQGNVDRAVGLLRRAKQLDPANPLIARDLSRAERIAATVRARK